MDQCVQCGLCSAYCPTYQLNPLEAESPRGRLAIIQYDAQQIAPVSHTALKHINHCVGCNQCQTVCPSKVPFEALIDQFKANHLEINPLSVKLLLNTIKKPGGANSIKRFLQTYKKLGLQKRLQPLFRFSPFSGIHPLLKLISKGSQHQPKPQSQPESVALFTGCTGQIFDQQTLNDSISLLEHIGIAVTIPDKQYCCGALHQHNGFPDIAQELAAKNTSQFLQQNIKQVIFSANGCGRQLKTLSSEIQYTDIISFIYPHIDSLKFNPLNEEVFIHFSCSNSSLEDTSKLTSQLLQRIPGLQVTDISQNSCCGAGGSNLISQPRLASELIRDKIQQIKSNPPRYLLSDNIGCSLHFKNQLTSSGLELEVIHPVTLITRQLIQTAHQP